MHGEATKRLAEEHVREKEEKPIGFTIAVYAALLAVATVLGHDAHTKEVLNQATIVDEWNYYTAKHQRAHDYGRDAELALLLQEEPSKRAEAARALALKYYNKSIDEQCAGAPRTCKSPVPDLQEPAANPANAREAEKKGELGTPVVKAVAQNETKYPENPLAKERPGAAVLLDHVQQDENDEKVVSKGADFLDASVVILELSITLCTVSLLGKFKSFWKSSIFTAALGLIAMVWGCYLLWFPAMAKFLLSHQ